MKYIKQFEQMDNCKEEAILFANWIRLNAKSHGDSWLYSWKNSLQGISTAVKTTEELYSTWKNSPK